MVCPCCGWHFRAFLPYGIHDRPNALCPRCGSLERHRLLWLYFKNRTNLFTDKLAVLHFAPEQIFQSAFRAMSNLEYISTDLCSSQAMVRMDIANSSLGDSSFDVVLCCHVLEHVPDDRKAMRELFRVLKPGGWAVLQSPVDPTRDRTLEGGEKMSPEERIRLFDAGDHVRIYGRDYVERLQKAGFEVRVDGYVRELGAEMVRRYGLMEQEDVCFCRRPK